MAFTNTPNEGVPYYPPVRPEVPVANNRENLSGVAATGISAFVQMALGAQRAKLEQQEMLQRADLSARELEFRRDHMADAHDLAVRGQDIQSSIAFRNNDLDRKYMEAQIGVMDATKEVKEEQINQWKNGVTTAAQSVVEMGVINRKLRDKAEPDIRAAEDPELQTSDPVAFADLVESLHGQWGTAPTGSGIPQRIKALEVQADRQKSDIVLNGERTKLSNRMILRRLRSPETYDETYQGLKDAGHITEEGAAFDYGHPVDSIWNKVLGKGIKDKPSPTAEKLLKSAKDFDPTKVQSKVGPDVPRSAVDLRAQRQIIYNQGGTADSTPPPVADQNDTDAEIARYKLAISMGKDPAAAGALFRKNTGLDPAEISDEE